MYTIIGGGIGGLTTALAFEKWGIPYQVFERAPELNEVGAGIWLAPNALQVFSWLGLLDEVQEAGYPIERIRITASDLSILSDNDQNKFITQFGCTTIAILRSRLQEILYRNLPKEKVCLNKGCERFEYDGANKLCLYMSDGTKENMEYVIGADGIHSQVRKQLFPDSTLRYSGQTCWRAIAHYDLPANLSKKGIEMWGSRKRIGFSSISEDKVYWFAVASSKANLSDKEGKKQEALLKKYAGFHPIVAELIHHSEPRSIIRNDIWDLKPMATWFQDQICLVGDAAHATTPNMGQGAAQAIEDAYYLSHAIATSIDHSTAFRLFQQKRMSKAHSVVRQSWQIGKLAHWKFGQGLRNRMIKFTPKGLRDKAFTDLYTIEKW